MASVFGTCGNFTVERVVKINTLTPHFTSVTVDRSNKIIANATAVEGAIQYNWYLDGVFIKTTITSSTTMPAGGPCDSEKLLEVEAESACGISQRDGWTIFTKPCLGAFLVSPNPASTQITVQVDEEEETRQRTAAISATPQHSSARKNITSTEPYNESIVEVKITDMQGKVLTHRRLGAGTRNTSLDVSGLASGSYVVQIYNGKTWTTRHFVVMK